MNSSKRLSTRLPRRAGPALAVTGLLGLGLIATGPAARAAVTVTTSGDTTTDVYTYSGTDQTFLVPVGVTDLTVQLWGGGGAGDAYAKDNNFGIPTSYPVSGGGGAYVTGTLSVTGGDTYTIFVGGGGENGGVVYGNAGDGQAPGGGLAAILLNGTELVDAGAGGGASTANQHGGAGGAGGLTEGSAGGPTDGTEGGGGTQKAGGEGGLNDFSGGTVRAGSGSQFQGGDTNGNVGGGGGAGYYGGGAGATGGGGGGGSSYTDGAGFTFDTAASQDATGADPGGQGAANYIGGVGAGGVGEGNERFGGDAEVALTFTSNASPAPEPSQVGMLALMGLGLGGLILRARRKAAGA